MDRERREVGPGWALRDGSIAGIAGKQLPVLRPDDLRLVRIEGELA